jgi:hypothetical protein
MTTAECKGLLRLTDDTYTDDIEVFLPLVEDDLIAELGHAFQDGYVYRESGTALAFTRGDSDTHDAITDEDEEFLEHGFLSGMDIVIEGGYANVGLYSVDSASTDKLVLSEYGELIPQDQNDTEDDHYMGNIRVSRVAWPKALKLPAAKMVWHLINEARADDAQSESLDDYSITYFGSHAYPVRVVRMLDKWRRPAFR